MNHTITIGDLLRIMGALVGLALLGFGVMSFLAGGMSDAPAAGDEAGKTGCISGMVGIVIIVLMLCACATPVVSPSPSGCSSLIPKDWRSGVAGAPLPAGQAAGDWVVFGDAQTGKLDQANGRTKDTISIVSSCEDRDASAIKKATRGWLSRLFN